MFCLLLRRVVKIMRKYTGVLENEKVFYKYYSL